MKKFWNWLLGKNDLSDKADNRIPVNISNGAESGVYTFRFTGLEESCCSYFKFEEIAKSLQKQYEKRFYMEKEAGCFSINLSQKVAGKEMVSSKVELSMIIAGYDLKETKRYKK